MENEKIIKAHFLIMRRNSDQEICLGGTLFQSTKIAYEVYTSVWSDTHELVEIGLIQVDANQFEHGKNVRKFDYRKISRIFE